MAHGYVFWLFVGFIIGAAFLRDYANRREAQKTIRLAIEKNYPLDDGMLENVMRASRQSQRGAQRYAGGAVLVALSIGLPVMGYFVSAADGPRPVREAFLPLLGVGIMLGLMGAALLLVEWLADRGRPRDEGASR